MVNTQSPRKHQNTQSAREHEKILQRVEYPLDREFIISIIRPAV